MDRRQFSVMCASALGALAARSLALAQGGSARRDYARAKLVDAAGAPIKASGLEPQATMVFHYPYAGTPCFLVRLDWELSGSVPLSTADGRAYTWAGGVGPGRSIVAFCAICPHQLSYASKRQSFINYRSDESAVAGRSDVIVCCAHHSVFDPAQGGRVVAGPAPQPLTAIVLEHIEADDELFAVGTMGGELFEEFFRAYKIELIEQLGRGVARQEVSGVTTVLGIAEYTQSQLKC
jgi:Rieske Fe-S protein